MQFFQSFFMGVHGFVLCWWLASLLLYSFSNWWRFHDYSWSWLLYIELLLSWIGSVIFAGIQSLDALSEARSIVSKAYGSWPQLLHLSLFKWSFDMLQLLYPVSQTQNLATFWGDVVCSLIIFDFLYDFLISILNISESAVEQLMRVIEGNPWPLLDVCVLPGLCAPQPILRVFLLERLIQMLRASRTLLQLATTQRIGARLWLKVGYRMSIVICCTSLVPACVAALALPEFLYVLQSVFIRVQSAHDLHAWVINLGCPSIWPTGAAVEYVWLCICLLGNHFRVAGRFHEVALRLAALRSSSGYCCC